MGWDRVGWDVVRRERAKWDGMTIDENEMTAHEAGRDGIGWAVVSRDE